MKLTTEWVVWIRFVFHSNEANYWMSGVNQMWISKVYLFDSYFCLLCFLVLFLLIIALSILIWSTDSAWYFQALLIICFFLWCLTFNNISVISWRSVLLMEETGEPGENHWPVASHWQTLLHNVVLLALIEIRTHNISDDRQLCGFYVYHL
jgi:hypothetical protein